MTDVLPPITRKTGYCLLLASLAIYASPDLANAKNPPETNTSIRMLRLHNTDNQVSLVAHPIRPVHCQSEEMPDLESPIQRYTDDIEKWTLIIKHNPKNVAAYKARSEAFERRGASRADVCYALRDFKAATTDYTKAMSLNAEEASAYGIRDIKNNPTGASISARAIILSSLIK